MGLVDPKITNFRPKIKIRSTGIAEIRKTDEVINYEKEEEKLICKLKIGKRR